MVEELATQQEERDLAIRLYSDTRLPVDDIGEFVGVTRQTIYDWLDKAGVPLRGPMGPRSRLGADSDEGASDTMQLDDVTQVQAMAVLRAEHAEHARQYQMIQRQLGELSSAIASLKGSLETLVVVLQTQRTPT